MTKTINNIVAEFETLKPGIEADFIGFVTRRIERITEEAGGELTYNTVRQWTRKSRWNDGDWRSVQGFVRTANGSGMSNSPLVIAEEYLNKFAKQYAEDQVAAFTAKLIAKLGDLTDVELEAVNVNRFEFVITGKLGDRKVRVDQQVVFKCNSHGTRFCQWPARIYVDGKFTSEKKFKELAA